MKMMKMMTYAGAAALVGAMALTSPAQAVVVTWNTCDGDGTLNDCDISVPGPSNDFSIVESPRVHTNPAGSNNNFYTFTETVDAEARTLVARAYRTDTADGGITTTAILPAEINIFEGGLGVHWEIDGADDESTSSPDHAVDNIGFDELVLFEFADPNYEPLSFMTGWGCAFGTDGNSSCEYGGTNDILTFIGGDGILAAFLSYLQTGIALAGFTAELFDDVPIGESQTFSNDATGKFLIIAAASAAHVENVQENSGFNFYTAAQVANFDTEAERDAYCATTYASTGRSGFDSFSFSSSNKKFKCKWTAALDKDGGGAFKLAQVVGVLEPPREVPEPLTVALLGAGLVGLGVARRRKAA